MTAHQFQTVQSEASLHALQQSLAEVVFIFTVAMKSLPQKVSAEDMQSTVQNAILVWLDC